MALLVYILFKVLLIFIANTYGEITSSMLLGRNTQQILPDYDYDWFKQLAMNTANYEKVKIQLYYETFCGDCRNFDTKQFKEVVETLSPYLDIQTYPYGNAETYEEDGKYKFKCQHGPDECYGNKLHACALHIIRTQTQALLYNICMMDYSQMNRGSDDPAADKCGTQLSIDAEPIKACAKGEMGRKLLKFYGDESKSAKFQYVPYILINGKESDGIHFMKDVCLAFVNPPPACF